VGFLAGWSEFWMSRPGSIAALAVAFANASMRSVVAWLVAGGFLETTLVDDQVFVRLAGLEFSQDWFVRGLAITAIVVLAAVNYCGTRWGGLMQDVTTFLKVGTLLAIMALPFLTGSADTSLLSTTYERPVGTGIVAGFFMAMSAVFWAYDGWHNLGPMSEEIRDPQKNIPLGLTLGMFILIALYLGATVAYHLALPMDAMASSKFVAASAFEHWLGDHGAEIASAAVMVSTFGALNANLLCGPRMIFAMARDGLFLRGVGRVHPTFRTPHRAIVSETVLAIGLILGANLLKSIPVPAWVDALPGFLAGPLRASLENMHKKAIFDVLTDYVIFASFIFYTLAVAAVFVLRRRRPDLPRPYRTFGYPWVPATFVVCSLGFLTSMLITSPVEATLGSLLIGLGIVAYLFRPNRAANAQRGSPTPP
jgi:APA family basic amino acid/polyamine antiporter